MWTAVRKSSGSRGAICTRNTPFLPKRAGRVRLSRRELLARSINTFAVARNSDGRLEVFFTTAQNSVFTPGRNNWLGHMWQRMDSSGNIVGWSAPVPLVAEPVDSFQVAINEDGRLEVFYINGTNTYSILETDKAGQVNHIWQDSRQPSGWAGPERLIGGGARDLIVGENPDGRLELFVIQDSEWGFSFSGAYPIVHLWQLGPNAGWSEPVALGNERAKNFRDVYNLVDENGRLSIIYVGADGKTYRSRQQADGTWIADQLSASAVRASRARDCACHRA